MKINKKQHITKRGIIKKNPTTVKRFRVYDVEQNNFGEDKINIKYYTNLNKAMLDFNNRIKEMIEDFNLLEDYSGSKIEDLLNNKIIKEVYVDDDTILDENQNIIYKKTISE